MPAGHERRNPGRVFRRGNGTWHPSEPSSNSAFAPEQLCGLGRRLFLTIASPPSSQRNVGNSKATSSDWLGCARRRVPGACVGQWHLILSLHDAVGSSPRNPTVPSHVKSLFSSRVNVKIFLYDKNKLRLVRTDDEIQQSKYFVSTQLRNESHRTKCTKAWN